METINTPEDHIRLLLERGYLGQNQKNDWQLGYWRRELIEQYEICRAQATQNSQHRRFMMKLTVKFNEQLTNIAFTFRYKYVPEHDSLSLASLYAAFGPARKTYYFSRSEDLAPAHDVYELFSRADSLRANKTLYADLERQYKAERDPDNDHYPDSVPTKASKQDLTDPPTGIRTPSFNIPTEILRQLPNPHPTVKRR